MTIALQRSTAAAAIALAAFWPPSRVSARAASVRIEMRNVHLRLDEGIAIDIWRLQGDMRSLVEGRPPDFDNPRSYQIDVRSAEMWMDMPSVSELLNRHVFGYEGAPLSGIVVRTTGDGRIEQKASLKKGIRVPVAMTASVGTTPDGKLKLHVESQRVAGIRAGGLLHLVGLKLENLVHLDPARGVTINGDDLQLDIARILPPPRVAGRLSRANVDGDRLHQVIGSGDFASIAPKDSPARNYIYFSGSTLKFGKLTMSDTDLQLIDDDNSDAFDFYPARYKLQLVAGYSKNTPDGGLRTHMPDYADAGRKPIGR